jgi:hypothetical protein
VSNLTGLVLSKDRPAQLDLLLSSIASNAPSLFKQVTVLYHPANRAFLAGYRALIPEHPAVKFRREKDFPAQVRHLVEHSTATVAFLCDDDIVWRWMVEPMLPSQFLAAHSDVLCVSLRLGKGLTDCYPLRRKQAQPNFVWRHGMNVWKYASADGDYSYPGSLDGDCFRRDHLRLLIRDGDWASPNELEEHLTRECRRTELPLMACYGKSLVVGVPANRVQDSHPNRHGDMFPLGAEELNREFLAGRRLRVENLSIGDVRAAHHEVDLTAKEDQ